MKSFFAAAAVAATALAYEECNDNGECWWVEEADIRRDIEWFLEDLGRTFEDIQEAMEDPEAAKQEAQEEFQREVEKTMEDLECWWADRAGGDGQCAKRERREAEDACWQTGNMVWDWDNQDCITQEEYVQRQKDECIADGWQWIALREDWGEECYRNEPWQTCYMEHDDWEWNWELEECMSQQDNCESYDLNTWQTDEWGGWCEWNWLKKMPVQKQKMMSKTLSKHPKIQHKLITYSIDLDFDYLEDIWAPVAEGEEEGEALVEEMMTEWGPILAQWQEAQTERERQAFCDLAEEMAWSIWVGETPIANMEDYEAPDGCSNDAVLVKNLKRSRSVRKAIFMQESMNGMTISFNGPTEEELDSWLMDIQDEMEEIASTAEAIANEFKPRYEDLDRELEDAFEDEVGPMVEDLVNGFGDDLKEMVGDSGSVQWWDVALARKQAQAAATASKKPSRAGFYAGVSFGVLGVVAAAAMIATCNKKKVQENEEALL